MDACSILGFGRGCCSSDYVGFFIMSSWINNINDDCGMLVTDAHGTIHIVSHIDGDIAKSPISDLEEMGSKIDYVEYLKPITPEEWWQFAPWQDIETAPTQEYILGKRKQKGLPVAICFVNSDIAREQFHKNYTKWLPIPKGDL